MTLRRRRGPLPGELRGLAPGVEPVGPGGPRPFYERHPGRIMGLIERALHGAVGGVGATVALTGLRQVMARAGLVEKSAPEQVVGRLEDLGLVDDWSKGARFALTIAAHLAYGTGLGASLGLLRRERGSAAEEAGVGSALGMLSWAANWSALLPILGVHEPPWKQRSPRVLLPVIDHAFFGAVWGLIFRHRASWARRRV